MITIAGTICFGLVWGWVAGHAAYRMRWLAVLIAIGGLVAQGLLFPAFAAEPMRRWWLTGSAIGLIFALGWLRALVNRVRTYSAI